MNDTAIRRATSEDIDAVAPLFDAYRGFYGQPSDLARARDWLRARMEGGDSVVFMAEHGAAAVGFVQLYPMFTSVGTARTWILNDLYVDAAARRNGVARGLLDAAVEFARSDGARGIVLETTRDNAAARALYRNAGWSEDQTQWYSLSLV